MPKGTFEFHPPVDGKKKCTKCLETKPVELFPFVKKTGKYHANCRACATARSLEARSKKRDQYIARQAEYRASVKDACFKAYGGYVCACCGEDTKAFLTLDHVNNDGATHRKAVGRAGTAMYRWMRDNGFPEGFQVLCWNCNCGKRMNKGICPHLSSEGATTIAKASTAQVNGAGSARHPIGVMI